MALIAQLVSLSFRQDSWGAGPLQIDMAAFSSRKRAAAFPVGSSLDFLPLVKAHVVM
jgi:hypothetical protein